MAAAATTARPAPPVRLAPPGQRDAIVVDRADLAGAAHAVAEEADDLAVFLAGLAAVPGEQIDAAQARLQAQEVVAEKAHVNKRTVLAIGGKFAELVAQEQENLKLICQV